MGRSWGELSARFVKSPYPQALPGGKNPCANIQACTEPDAVPTPPRRLPNPDRARGALYTQGQPVRHIVAHNTVSTETRDGCANELVPTSDSCHGRKRMRSALRSILDSQPSHDTAHSQPASSRGGEAYAGASHNRTRANYSAAKAGLQKSNSGPPKRMGRPLFLTDRTPDSRRICVRMQTPSAAKALTDGAPTRLACHGKSALTSRRARDGAGQPWDQFGLSRPNEFGA
jgi:hypothetical protein